MNITLRRACDKDAEIVLAWRNEPTTIPWMGANRVLSPEEHDLWFTRAIADTNVLFFIIEGDGVPVGQIRYHLSAPFESKAKVSINITQTMQGKGIASEAFKKGDEQVRMLRWAKQTFARVRVDNRASIKALEKAGYACEQVLEAHGAQHWMMVHYLEESR